MVKGICLSEYVKGKYPGRRECGAYLLYLTATYFIVTLLSMRLFIGHFTILR